MISILPAGILAITYKKHPSFRGVIQPIDATDLVLSQSRCDGESDDPPDWNLQTRICVECGHEPIEFVLRRPPVAFVTPTDQTKTSQSDTSQFDWLRRMDYAMNRRRMSKDCFYITKVDSYGDRASTFPGAFLSELDQLFAVDFR